MFNSGNPLTITYADFEGGAYLLESIPIGDYTVTEITGPNETGTAYIEGYDLNVTYEGVVTGTGSGGLFRGAKAESIPNRIPIGDSQQGVMTITNDYSAPTPGPEASATIEVTKEFNDWTKAGSFTFQLTAVTADAPMPNPNTASATEADPKAVFEALTFTQAGTYEYTLTEIDDGVEGVTYDTEAHKVIVAVIWDEEAQQLRATVTYDGNESLTITNLYVEPAPDTGDSGRPLLWMILLTASLLGILAIVLRPRKLGKW